MFLQILLLIHAVSADPASPFEIDGNRLREGRACYDILLNDEKIGTTVQTIEAVEHGLAPAWKITIHQAVPARSFEMRDEFLVDRDSLLPISLVSQQGEDRNAQGWQLVSVMYEDDRIAGTRETRGGVLPIDVRTSAPVWDGNLWGPLFASLPLEAGADFTIPIWQYDNGFGEFRVEVSGSGPYSTYDGTEPSWFVEAGTSPERRSRYVFSQASFLELSSGAGPLRQELSQSCASL